MNTSPSNITLALLATTLLFFILGGFAVVFTIIYKKKQEKNKEEFSKRELKFQKELLLSQVEIQEKTLETISQEIHDNIGQVLSAAILTIRLIKSDNEKVIDSIKQVDELMTDAMKNLRQLSHSLNTERILERGFVEALKFEVTILKRLGKNVEMDLDCDSMSISPQIELILFRIVQECIANIIKHADARNIIINSYCTKELFSIEIIDDGKGFDMSNNSNGIGLKNILNRSKLINANTNILSALGKGTKIKIVVNTQ